MPDFLTQLKQAREAATQAVTNHEGPLLTTNSFWNNGISDDEAKLIGLLVNNAAAIERLIETTQKHHGGSDKFDAHSGIRWCLCGNLTVSCIYYVILAALNGGTEE